ncbi:MAG: hypothetical protein Q8P67_15175, partial [archaeon]|nr:hypothetical protein [archaeon]
MSFAIASSSPCLRSFADSIQRDFWQLPTVPPSAGETADSPLPQATPQASVSPQRLDLISAVSSALTCRLEPSISLDGATLLSSPFSEDPHLSAYIEACLRASTIDKTPRLLPSFLSCNLATSSPLAASNSSSQSNPPSISSAIPSASTAARCTFHLLSPFLKPSSCSSPDAAVDGTLNPKAVCAVAAIESLLAVVEHSAKQDAGLLETILL